MHSAEHILNQTMIRMFDCGRCFNAHIERKKSKCDYHFDRPLSEDETQGIQDAVNRIIQADLPVTESHVSIGEAAEVYNLQKLPQDAGNSIRIVHVGDYDACPCIGPHVASTKDISGFLITATQYENGKLRIRFKLRSGILPRTAALTTAE